MKVLIPTFIIAAVFILSAYGTWRLLHLHSAWKWCAMFPILLLYIIIYGFTIGYLQLKVTEITYESPTVPKAFDGYRIAQISDIHTGGGFMGPYHGLMDKAVKKVNDLKPDMICVTGDLQNFLPTETEQFTKELSSLHAPDGVFSIMGNHDYCSYSNLTPSEQGKQIQKTRDLQKQFGWTLLQDENRTIKHGEDSIIVVGEENWGLPPFPQRGNIKKAVKGLNINPATKQVDSTLVLMLSHDPNAWEHHIRKVINPDITLSGHTHGTQFSFLGWCPASLAYKYWGGEYHSKRDKKIDINAKANRKPFPTDDLMLYVSTGFGGNLPFRFGMPREIVVLTLKHKDK